MACRDTLKVNTSNTEIQAAVPARVSGAAQPSALYAGTMYFGVDSLTRADTVLQNNLTLFQWVARNKLVPNYWGRAINGKNAVTLEEIDFLHRMGCKVACLYSGDSQAVSLEAHGAIDGKKAVIAAVELGIPAGTAIFLEVKAGVTDAYLKGYASALLSDGYTPGFCADTDSSNDFDHQFSRGQQKDPETFGKCLLWAVSPSLPEYYRTNDSHQIHPDAWAPHCPSGMTQNQVAVWQYGRECHPINDYAGRPTSFDISIVKDPSVVLNRMF